MPVLGQPTTSHPLEDEETPTVTRPKGSGFRRGAYRGRTAAQTRVRLSTDRIPAVVVSASVSSGSISIESSPPNSRSASPKSPRAHASSPGHSPVFEPSSPPPPQFLHNGSS